MRCASCKLPIVGLREQQRAFEIVNDRGQIVGMKHFKCSHVDTKHRGKRHYETPTAYEMTQGVGRINKDDLSPEMRERRERAEREYAALLERQKEIAQQRGLEEVPSRWDDWREPEELELEELVEAVEQLRDPSSG